MMISRIDGAEMLPDDAFVLAQLRRVAARNPIYGAAVLIAIHNAHDEICRLVTCVGARQTQRVTSCLCSLGFVQRFVLGSPFHYTFRR